MAKGSFLDAKEFLLRLQEIKSMGDFRAIHFRESSLVLDWHMRKARLLIWIIDSGLARPNLNAGDMVSSIRRITEDFYPSAPISSDYCPSICDNDLYKSGFVLHDDVIDKNTCLDLINKFKGIDKSCQEVNDYVFVNGIVENVLRLTFEKTGLPHLVTKCFLSTKTPDDKSASNQWHYDNEVNEMNPTLMVYLNSQEIQRGATKFVDISSSASFSESTGYMGFVDQRDTYDDYIKEFASGSSLDLDENSPPHFTFCPDKPGSGVWFRPARVLHRGVKPKTDSRHVLFFLLCALPCDCNFSVKDCCDLSREILNDNITHQMFEGDASPYYQKRA